MDMRTVVIAVSTPAVAIKGGWTGMKPCGLVRTYSATVDGVQYVNTSKSNITRVIRAALYRAGVKRVRFEFAPESER